VTRLYEVSKQDYHRYFQNRQKPTKKTVPIIPNGMSTPQFPFMMRYRLVGRTITLSMQTTLASISSIIIIFFYSGVLDLCYRIWLEPMMRGRSAIVKNLFTPWRIQAPVRFSVRLHSSMVRIPWIMVVRRNRFVKF
jgi:hypothetical protein